MSRTMIELILLGAAALAARPASSQSWSDPGAGVGGHAAYTKGRDANDGKLSGGVQVRARLTGGLGVEALASYRREDQVVGTERVLKIEEVPVQISAMLFFFHRTRLQPYLLGGIGYYYVRASGEGSNASFGSRTENKFGFHGGGGLEARLSPRTSLHADVRYVFRDVDSVTALRERYDVDRRADFWHATGGLTLYF